MTLKIRKIFAVIDPTTDQQVALARALDLAKTTNASVHAYLCCYSAVETDHFLALKRVEMARHEAWLEKIAGAENTNGANVTIQVDWSEDWRSALADAAANANTDLIVKAAYEHSAPGRFFLKTSDWAVLRHAQSPVLLVKRGSTDPLRRVLISVNPKAEDEKHQQLSENIISFGRQIADDSDNFELHAVCAQTGSESATEPLELAELVGIDVSRAHCSPGHPDDVIVDCAGLLQSDLVVIGSVSREGFSGLAKGNTAERALDRLSADVLVMTASG